MPRLIVMLTGTLGKQPLLARVEMPFHICLCIESDLEARQRNEEEQAHMAPRRQSSSMLHRKHTMQRSGPVYAEGISIITIIVVIMLTSVAVVHTVEEPEEVNLLRDSRSQGIQTCLATNTAATRLQNCRSSFIARVLFPGALWQRS